MSITENQGTTTYKKLYSSPLPASRSGALFNAFSYPTKISPESIALFVACHTLPGETVLDPFAGSGTTGLAVKLCDQPTPVMLEMAKKLRLKPEWGPRKAVLYELSAIGSFAAETMCNPVSSQAFAKTASEFLSDAERKLEPVYTYNDKQGNQAKIRYTIWSDVLKCADCSEEWPFWNVCVIKKPLGLRTTFTCPHCGKKEEVSKVPRATETVKDKLLGTRHTVKKRVPVKIFFERNGKNGSHELTAEEQRSLMKAEYCNPDFPLVKISWGDLFRRGYHQGITHLHHFYSSRNAFVFSSLWKQTENYDAKMRDALRLWLLSYNATHSTLMTRVVLKKNMKDFVLTGAQSGVMYISSLPVEKNIIHGLKRKIDTFTKAFAMVEKSKSDVQVLNASSTHMQLPPGSVDYIFTDPPFGGYIPYSEINQLNEAWLGKKTNQKEEVIVSAAQEKGLSKYRKLMQRVFCESEKVLKKDGAFTLVFHSAKADIWQALMSAYQQAGFEVAASGILDKLQGSFKQVSSEIKVQGDPLILLKKASTENMTRGPVQVTPDLRTVRKVIKQAYAKNNVPGEQKRERIYARYINGCLQAGKPVVYDARTFYRILEEEMAQGA